MLHLKKEVIVCDGANNILRVGYCNINTFIYDLLPDIPTHFAHTINLQLIQVLQREKAV